MDNQIIIFGCGILGKTAYQFYKSYANIICFVDNRKDMWGKNFEGIPICPPEILHKYDLNEIGIIIAVKNNWNEIQQQLFYNYNVVESVLFRVESQCLAWGEKEDTFDFEKPEIIICYMGGIGNQMFQYAFARCFIKQGKNVTGDISEYSIFKNRKFELPVIFQNIIFKKCGDKYKKYYENIMDCQYKEVTIYETDCLEANIDILGTDKGIFKGYWQSNEYVKIVAEELREDFKFRNKKDVKLQSVIDKIKGQNVVSVHIRRGDYFQANELYGGICTKKYYEAAMQFLVQHEENIVFYFFSNDIQWVKDEYKEVKNAVFIQSGMFEDYEDWYDMYIMSNCKHNIIANSSFSWWGAWLNSNEGKIVIAPQKWINGIDMPEICPKEWLRLNEEGDVLDKI